MQQRASRFAITVRHRPLSPFPQAEYVQADSNFVVPGRSYERQYAQLYFARLRMMAQRVQEAAAAKWPRATFVKILEVPEDKEVAVVGTIFKVRCHSGPLGAPAPLFWTRSSVHSSSIGRQSKQQRPHSPSACSLAPSRCIRTHCLARDVRPPHSQPLLQPGTVTLYLGFFSFI